MIVLRWKKNILSSLNTTFIYPGTTGTRKKRSLKWWQNKYTRHTHIYAGILYSRGKAIIFFFFLFIFFLFHTTANSCFKWHRVFSFKHSHVWWHCSKKKSKRKCSHSKFFPSCALLRYQGNGKLCFFFIYLVMYRERKKVWKNVF